MTFKYFTYKHKTKYEELFSFDLEKNKKSIFSKFFRKE